jgi:hypothetical protein
MISTGTNKVYNTITTQKFLSWGKFGVGINVNLCNEFLKLTSRGLKILVSGVQVPFLASFKTPLCVGFSCFYPQLYLVGGRVDLAELPRCLY